MDSALFGLFVGQIVSGFIGGLFGLVYVAFVVKLISDDRRQEMRLREYAIKCAANSNFSLNPRIVKS